MCSFVPQYIDAITSIYLLILYNNKAIHFYIITAKFYFTVQYHILRIFLFKPVIYAFFSLITSNDIFSINRLTMILKIIGHHVVKHNIMMLPIKKQRCQFLRYRHTILFISQFVLSASL